MSDIHPNYMTIKTVYKFLFERLFFLLAFLTMFLVIFSLANEVTTGDPDSYVANTQANTFFAIIAGILTLGFLTLVVVNGIYPSIFIFPMFMHPKYPVYYAIYNSGLILVLISFHEQTATPYALIGLVLANIIVLTCWKPYKQNVHNVTIVFEQTVVVLALAIYIV